MRIKKKWEDLGYMGKHKRIWKEFGKAIKCEVLICKKKSKTYTWANMSGKYKQDRKDWKQMCMSCHMKRDHCLRRPYRVQLQILLNGLDRIRDEINFLIKNVAE